VTGPTTDPPIAAGPGAASDRRLLADPARQSPIALAFIGWKLVRNLGAVNIGIAFVFVFSGRVSGGLWLIGVIAAAVIAAFAAASWWRFTFQVAGDELVVTKGILSVERLTIPFERVQSVGIDQKLLHRAVGLVSVSVDTAGSDAAEFVIDAVHREIADALQRVAAEQRSTPSTDAIDTSVDRPQAATVLLRRTPADLARSGATKIPWAGLVALAPLIALGNELGDLFGVDVDPDDIADNGYFSTMSPAATIAIAVGLPVVVTVVGVGLQVVRELLTSWNLTLVLSNTGLRRTAGLLNTTSTASTLRRVQSVTTDDTPPQRWLGMTEVGLRTVGAGDLVLPATTEDEHEALRRLTLGATSPPPLDRSISRWFVFLRTRNAAVLAAPIVALGWFMGLRWWALLGFATVALAWLSARRRWRLRRWGINDDRIAESYTMYARHTAEIRLVKAQSVSVSQSFFERRKGLATVRMSTAEGHLAVPLVALADAQAVRDRILFAVESSNVAFM
jgi:putative membrane protein